MDTPPAAPANRLPGLDLLRAVAIGWVLLYHASLFDLVSATYWIVGFGWMGVDLFFVLSGFLIAGQLLRPRARGETADYPRFFARRLLRTLPAYLAIVALYFLVPAARDRPQLQPLWQFLTFTENFDLHFPLPRAFSHAWSLCVEEQFYLVLPIIIALLAIRPSVGKVFGAMIAVLLGGMAVRGYFWLHGAGSDPFGPAAHVDAYRYMTLIYYPSWSRLDGLLAGVAIAAVQVFRPDWWRRITVWPNALLAGGVAGVGVAIVFFQGMYAPFLPSVFGFPLLALSMGMLVIAGADSRSIIGRTSIPGAGALAAGAYSLYLSNKIAFHAIALALADWPPQIRAYSLVVGLLAALVAGAVLYWLVERPFLKIRDRLRSPSRGRRTIQPPASAEESASAIPLRTP
jgi:peptidoglycan/LPS O-acetylase OafA/YrhL